jgi:hypothetical protein
VRDGREQRHVKPALGDQDLRGVGLDAGDRAQQLDDVGVRCEYEPDPFGRFWTAASSVSMCASSWATMTP